MMLQKSPDIDLDGTPVSEGDDALLCRSCDALITRERWKISVAGHQHHFTNPLGVEFEVCLFEQAPGVLVVGAATLDHTWFPGFKWSLVQCGNCHIHMGWFYEGAENPPRFFGLIGPKLKR